MALSVKDAGTDRLIRELAGLTGETMTETVRTAVRDRLARESTRRGASQGPAWSKVAKASRAASG
jgi:antitoxin VapB